MTQEELQVIQERVNKAMIRGMEVEVSEEGIVFVGKLVADPVETLREALDEVERLNSTIQTLQSTAGDLIVQKHALKVELIHIVHAKTLQEAHQQARQALDETTKG